MQRRAADRHRRRRDGADPRRRRPAARGARLVRHRVASPRTAARSMSGIERVQPDRALRLSPRTGLLARGQPIAVPPGIALAALQQGPRGAGVRAERRLPRSAGTLIAISERGLDAAGNIIGFLIGGPQPGRLRGQAQPTISTSATARSCRAATSCAGTEVQLDQRGVAMRIRRIALAEIKPRRAGRRAGCCSSRPRLRRSTTWKA